MPVELRPLQPREALAFFRAKGLAQSYDFRDVERDEHARAFTVAKAMSRDVLTDIRDAVDAAIEDGTTLETFKTRLRPLLQARGWWGRQEMADPATGETKRVQLGSPRRLETIFETNLRTAYQAGRWERIQATKAALPFLQYHHTPQRDPRPEHEAWGAQPVILPVDDAWWHVHYPPNGWRCRCWISQLSASTLARRGLTVTANPTRFPPVTSRNPRTGEVIVTERGIDPSFANNVGRAYLAPMQPSPGPGGEILPTGPNPAPVRAPLPPPSPGPGLLANADADEAQAAFLGAFGSAPGETRIVEDVTGEQLVIGPQLFRDAAGGQAQTPPGFRSILPLAARAILDPDEIRWTWVRTPGGPVRMTRRYIARQQVEGVGDVGVAVDLVSGSGAPGWGVSTTLQAGFDLEAARVGELAWRRGAAEVLNADLTGPEAYAINYYTGIGGEVINRAIRARSVMPPFSERQRDVLDALLARAVLPQPIRVWRGIKAAYANAVLRGSRPGRLIVDEAFFSTSRQAASARKFAGIDGLVFELVLPAGTRALDVSRVSAMGDQEGEVLLPRGSRFRVLSWDRKSRILQVILANGD